MGTIAFLGDDTTTTALAVAATWSAEPAPTVIESDASGGSLAAWLGVPVNPSLSTIVARTHALDSDPTVAHTDRDDPLGGTLDVLVRTSAAGLRFVPAPVRSREADRAIDEAARSLLPRLAASERTALVDVGRFVPAVGMPRPALGARSVVLCHRQESASAGAAAVRLERLAESVEVVTRLDVPITIALIGDQPYGGDEILCYLDGDEADDHTAGAPPSLVTLPVDPLAAAVLAGRAGVSPRRLRRLPLLRAAASLATHLAAQSGSTVA